MTQSQAKRRRKQAVKDPRYASQKHGDADKRARQLREKIMREQSRGKK